MGPHFGVYASEPGLHSTDGDWLEAGGKLMAGVVWFQSRRVSVSGQAGFTLGHTFGEFDDKADGFFYLIVDARFTLTF